MKVFAATDRDNELERMRVEFTAEDIDTFEGLIERLDALLKVEAALDVVAERAQTILGSDTPTVTQAAREMIVELVRGWDPSLAPREGEVFTFSESP